MHSLSYKKLSLALLSLLTLWTIIYYDKKVSRVYPSAHDVILSSGEEERSFQISSTAIVSDECRVILKGDLNKIQKLRDLEKDFPWSDNTTDCDVIKFSSNCIDIYKRYNFLQLLNPNVKVTEEELSFPIAYSILAHENVNQILVLLSAIYRKHNVHCIHLDVKAKSETYTALMRVLKCFPNVFLSTKRIKVIYEHVSRLEADIACMEDLLAIPKYLTDWKYLINLCSQDFPLLTNKEIVEQLKQFRGYNSIGGYTTLNDMVRKRTQFIYRVENVTQNDITQERMVMTSHQHPPPPLNMTVVKNLAYNLYSREFLQWALLDSDVGTKLLEWSRDTFSPDEHFWLMLHRYPGAPGGSQLASGFQLARKIKWLFTNDEKSCHGKWRHYICVFGAEDIHELTRGNEMFVNKLDVTLDSTGSTCLRQMLDESTLISSSKRNSSNPDKKPVTPSASFFL